MEMQVALVVCSNCGSFCEESQRLARIIGLSESAALQCGSKKCVPIHDDIGDGGRKIYLLGPGIQTKREDLVDVLGVASIDQVGTVDEQRIAYEHWLGSLK